MFVTTIVVGAISFLSTVTLTTRPFTRDVLFYLGAVSWAFITLYKENITLGEAIGTNIGKLIIYNNDKILSFVSRCSHFRM